MNRKIFYLLTNNLYLASPLLFRNEIIKNIISKSWFKKACKENKIKIILLSKNISTSKKYYVINKSSKYLFDKYSMIQFRFEKLENNNHLKLLNINLRNETLFNVINYLISIQSKFLETKHYKDLLQFERKDFIKMYQEKYNKYLDLSIFSKILNYCHFKIETKEYKIIDLFPSKLLFHSILIREIINKYINIHSDDLISKKLKEKYKINISRRKVNYIRNKYLILNKNKQQHIHKEFTSYEILSKINLRFLKYKQKGIYELSSKRICEYPYMKIETLYIGSTNNLRKRLLSYTSIEKGHNKNMESFFRDLDILYFRVLKTRLYKEYEKHFIDLFIKDYGSLPILNKQRILNIKTSF
ncbi:MAG: GIY-YIG nuclease family protein [Aliarcobacter sp.]|nr:GIY-YIG nuclease family protein [Aliarcobacter sp.]